MTIPTFSNLQKPEPQVKKSSGESLDIVDLFHTIQGEGPFTGQPAIFIRLAGCNLQCPYCDTNYTEDRRHRSIEYIALDVDRILTRFPMTDLVVITGGEPLRQNIVPLIELLYASNGVHVQIESNGVFPPTSKLTELIHNKRVTLVVSPKTSRISATAAQWATAYKYVLSADSLMAEDGLPREALGHRATPYIARPLESFQGKVYVNPMDAQDPETNKENIVACRDSALRFGYTMGIQLHKLVELP